MDVEGLITAFLGMLGTGWIAGMVLGAWVGVKNVAAPMDWGR